MSNFLNPSMLSSMILEQLEYELVIGRLMYRDQTTDFSSVRGLKVGSSVDFRTATDFRVDEFTSSIATQAVNQSATTMTIEKHFDTSVSITAKERALNLDGIQTEIASPVAVALAQKIDEYLGTKITESQGLYASSAATLLSNAANIALTRKAALLQQISKANMIGLVNEDLEATLLGTDAFSKFDTRGAANSQSITNGDMGRLLGIDWHSSVNLPTVSQVMGNGVGALDSTVATDNVQGNSTLKTTSTTGTFNAGDKIKIAGAKRHYTVATTTAATATSIPIVEQINEDLRSLGSAAITEVSSGNTVAYKGVIFNPNAYGFAMPALDVAAGAMNSAVATSNGYSVRVVEQYDISTKSTVWSFDCLIGAKLIDTRKSILLGSF